MEPHFSARFGEIIDQYRQGKIDFAEAKRNLADWLGHHCSQPNRTEVGFDLSSVDPPIKLLLSEVLEEMQSSFFRRAGLFCGLTIVAQRMIYFASRQAMLSGTTAIKTEHLLIGLIQAGRNLLVRFLSPSDTVESMLKQLAVESDRQEQRPASLEYVLSAESKNVLAYAEELAQRDSQKLVGTVHLLMGLLREEAGLAAKVLRQHGVELSRIRSEFS
jgi:hypothetical protein